MASSVKTVFKGLLYPMIAVAFFIFIVEILNVNMQAPQVRHGVYTGVKNASTLFVQETYKQTTKLGIQDIVTRDNSLYVSKDFYWGYTDATSIFRRLYVNDECLNTLRDLNNQRGNSNISSVTLLYNGIYKLYATGNVSRPATPSIGSSTYDWDKYNNDYISYLYMNNNYTPINIGITYFNEEVLLEMSKWNVANILSNSNSFNITDEDESGNHTGNYYVQFHGFKCYVKELSIDNIDYKVYDIQDANQRKQYFELTGIDVKGNEFGSTDSSVANGLGYDFSNINSDDRRYLTVATVNYSMPVSYKGITPIANFVNWATAGFNVNWRESRDSIQGSFVYTSIS